MADDVTVWQQTCRAALQLQEQRCALYHALTRTLHTTLQQLLARTTHADSSNDDDKAAAAAAARDVQARRTAASHALQSFLATSFVPDLQRINTALRQLQQQQQGEDDKDKATRMRTRLRAWVDALQAIEQQHYAVTVRLLAAVTAHCRLAQHKHSDNNNNDDDDKNNEDDEVRACDDGRAHDAQRCALAPMLLHLRDTDDDDDEDEDDKRAHTALYFVSCRDVDTLHGDDDESESDNNEEDEDAEKRQAGSATATVYNTSRVARRCGRWSMAWRTAQQHRTQLQRQAAELVDELQCELSDACD